MTRLIDADALSKLVGEPIEVFLRRLDLKLPPTVDAVPVEWIKKFTEESKRHIQGSVNNYTYMYDYMLSEWKQRKEE